MIVNANWSNKRTDLRQVSLDRWERVELVDVHFPDLDYTTAVAVPPGTKEADIASLLKSSQELKDLAAWLSGKNKLHQFQLTVSGGGT